MPEQKKCYKKCFQSRKEAKKHMKDGRKNYGFEVSDVYFCKECLQWHGTSIGKQQSRDYRRFLKNKNRK